MFFFYTFFFILGLIIGSFLNVVIYRVLRGESIVYPSSRCPQCLTPLRYLDLIPVISYISLGGRCRYCGNPISIVYPLVEISTGLLFIWSYYSLGLNFKAIEFIVLGSILIALSVIDFKEFILPDSLVLTALIFGVVIKVFYWLYYQDPQYIYKSFLGGVLAFSFFYLIFLLFPNGMGGGDVKLSFVLGFYTGFPFMLLWLFLSFFLGSIGGIIYLAILRKRIKEPLPFGPFLALASLLTLAWGTNIYAVYFNLFW